MSDEQGMDRDEERKHRFAPHSHYTNALHTQPRTVMLIPFFIKKPVDWAIGYGLKRLKKGEGYVEGEDEGES